MTTEESRRGRPPRRGRPRDAGQSSVEFALVLPLVLTLLLLVVQAAVVLRFHLLVTHASREAARAAAVEPTAEAARTAAQQSADLDPGRLRVEVHGAAGAGSRVTATVSYDAPTEVPIVGLALPDVRVSGSTTMRVE